MIDNFPKGKVHELKGRVETVAALRGEGGEKLIIRGSDPG